VTGRHVARAGSPRAQVRGTRDVVVEYAARRPGSAAGGRAGGAGDRPPLFALELGVVDGAFGYSTDVDQLEAGPVLLLDAALRQLHDVPQVCRRRPLGRGAS
jgi:hypothetical protein